MQKRKSNRTSRFHVGRTVFFWENLRFLLTENLSESSKLVRETQKKSKQGEKIRLRRAKQEENRIFQITRTDFAFFIHKKSNMRLCNYAIILRASEHIYNRLGDRRRRINCVSPYSLIREKLENLNCLGINISLFPIFKLSLS